MEKQDNYYDYDLVLIQPPLFKKYYKSSNTEIEKVYWKTMYEKGGVLLGDLAFEGSSPLLSIGSYLKKQGKKVKILDFHIEDMYIRYYKQKVLEKENILEELKKYKAKFYGITVMTVAEKISNYITNIIREISPDSFIFWGGFYPTNNAEKILKNNRNIDFIVRNEGELAIDDFITICQENKSIDLKKLKSISYLENNKVIISKTIPTEYNLDSIEYFDYSLYDNKYIDFLIPRVYSTRGCENSCVYCTANNSFSKKFRRRKIKNVVDEIEYIEKILKKKFFVMGDLEFLMEKEYSKSICEEMIKRGLSIKWWCQIYPKNIDNEIIGLMKKAGNIQIALGIESKNDTLLKDLNKEVNLDSSLKTIKIIKENGIQIQAYIIIGLPKDTLESIITNIKFIGKLVEEEYVDSTHIAIMVPYPGSELYLNSKKYGIDIVKEDEESFYMNCDYLGSSIPSYNNLYLSRYEIYSLWLFCLSFLQTCYTKRKGTGFSEMYKNLGIKCLFEDKTEIFKT